jgi:hypothetical protein
MISTARNFVERVINSRSKMIEVSVVSDAANAGTGTSRSGGLAVGNGANVLKLAGGTTVAGTAAGAAGTPGSLTSQPTPETNPRADQRRFAISLDGEPPQDVTVAADATTGTTVAASIQATVRKLKAADPTLQPAYDGFIAEYRMPVGGNPEVGGCREQRARAQWRGGLPEARHRLGRDGGGRHRWWRSKGGQQPQWRQPVDRSVARKPPFRDQSRQ